ncbi:hypothetical protein ABLI39_05570 [Pseudarthrobacter sp. B907]|uniref:hypothetical protein n=1 Tax=Pseudarthrobacter sp. B907 TaxID=3158261 RepID=UPI0032DB978A
MPFKDRDGKPFTVAGGTSFVIPAGARGGRGPCGGVLFAASIRMVGVLTAVAGPSTARQRGWVLPPDRIEELLRAG